MYIKHLADSANFKVVTSNKICNGLTGLLSEMPNDFIYLTLSDIKKTFYSIVDGYITLRIPNVLVREELNETANFLMEFILERYYKRI